MDTSPGSRVVQRVHSMLPYHGAPERHSRGGHSSSKAPASKDYGKVSVGGPYEKESVEGQEEKHGLCGFPDSCET